jgi:hypothetical protein
MDDMQKIGSSQPEYQRTAAELPPGMNPGSNAPAGVTQGGTVSEKEDPSSTLENPGWLIEKARSLYQDSTNYLDANITYQWERNLSHFRSQHALLGSAGALGEQNRKRSRLFRPKTRANVKKQESALAVAVFSTTDYADVQPQNRTDESQKLSAAINKELLQYRLNRRMPWFQTVQGAWQDTKVYGLCVTHQHWRYEVDTDVIPVFGDDGKPVMGDIENDDGTKESVPMGRERKVVRHDKLCCDNIPPENVRFSPMADWREPLATSPYVVILWPMTVGDALERMEAEDPKTGQPMWMKHSSAAVLATRKQFDSRVRRAREGNQRIDPAQDQSVTGELQTTVWAHMNILRVNGEDVLWWTMGTELLLTEPTPLRKLYPHLTVGERPFVMGFSTIETHRNYPAGDVEQTSGLQEEINLLANQRYDNVKLALNKRFYVRRGSQIDLDALIRNVPGGGVFMNDPEKDIKTESFQDVTSSSYQEQDRMSAEFDELAGAVNQESMMGAKGTDSVGKANIVSGGANMVQDYSIRIFMVTWMEPVLRQLLKLIQMYETDEAVLAMAGENLQLYQRFGTNEITDSMLMQDLNLQVNIGIGNTDPVRRVERLVFGVSKIMEIPGMAQRVKAGRLSDEIMGALGYRDSSLFFMTDDEAKKDAEENPPQPPPEIAVKNRELDIRDADNKARHEREAAELEMERELRMAETASKENLTLEQFRTKLGIETQRDRTARETAALKERNRLTEITLKAGQPGKGK